jgi:hypothetical protein
MTLNSSDSLTEKELARAAEVFSIRNPEAEVLELGYDLVQEVKRLRSEREIEIEEKARIRRERDGLGAHRDDLLTEVRRLRKENEGFRILDLSKQQQIEDLRARLSLYEPPEGERDLTLVCRACGTVLRPCPTNARYLACDRCENLYRPEERHVIPLWKWQASQRILNGEVPG